MKYFTLDWWNRCQVENDFDPFHRFREHFAAIRDALPHKFVARFETVSLHDTKLRKLELDVAAAVLTMDLDKSDPTIQPCQLHLVYSGVRSFQSIADPSHGLAGLGGYGDCGYEEAYVLEPGLFEHQILCSSGIELRIAFSDFDFEG